MRIALLGSLTVRDDEDRGVEPGGAKQRAVLAQLSLEPNRALGVDRLAEGVWGEGVPDRYRQNLQVYVSTWRRALDAGRPRGVGSRIVGHRDAYELIAGPEEIDVSRFFDQLRQGRDALADGRPDRAATQFVGALAEWRGDPLADLADQPFAAHWITALEGERLDALEARIEADLARGRDAEVCAELEGLVRRFPERERFWCQLALGLYRAGRQTESLATLDRAGNHLREEFGLDPSPDLQRLQREILRQEPSLLAAAPTAVAAPLPVPLTSCIGRANLTARLLSDFSDGDRLVTLLGPGGSGKTRLGLELGHRLVAEGRSVVWVPLAAEHRASEIGRRIAEAAGVADLDRFAETVPAHRPVVILDNVEQLPGAGEVLRPMLEELPALQVLATSRSPLLIPGESVVEVPPLAEDDLLTLFRERARAAAPGTNLDRHGVAVLRICRLLDGLPLAVELVAAQIRAYDLDDLFEELQAGRDPSAGPAAGARHQSLRNAVRWSVALLEQADREAFAKLSVLPGTFDRPTATALAGRRDAIDQLVNASLVQAVETEAGRRFRLLATIRAAAAELLVDEAEALDRLSAYWLSRASSTDLGSVADPRTMAAAAEDLPATERVVQRLVTTGRAEDGAAVVLALFRPLVQLRRGADLLRLASTMLDSGLAGLDRVRMSVVAGAAAYTIGHPSAPGLLAATDELPEEDHALRVIGHNYRCVFNADTGDSDAALLAAGAGLAAARASGRDNLIRTSLSAASWAALQRGAYDEAVVLAAEQRDHVESAVGMAMYWCDLALAQLFADDIDGAEHSAAQAIEVSYQVGSDRYRRDAFRLLGSVRLHQDQAVQAASLLFAALGDLATNNDEGWLLEVVAQVGLALVLSGRRAAGIDLIARAGGHARSRFGADSAVLDFDQKVAERLGVGAGEAEPTSDPIIELAAEARARAQELSAAATDHSGD